MKIQININCDNDTFGDDPNAEVVRIFRELALSLDLLEYGAPLTARRLRDTNGNLVGSFTVTP